MASRSPLASPQSTSAQRLRLPRHLPSESAFDGEVDIDSESLVHGSWRAPPRISLLAKSLAERSRLTAGTSNLAYDPKDWLATLKLLGLHDKGAFVLVPCALVTLWAALLALLDHWTAGALEDALPTYLPTVLGSTQHSNTLCATKKRKVIYLASHAHLAQSGVLCLTPPSAIWPKSRRAKQAWGIVRPPA